MNIPDSVTSIGEQAFYNCSSLTSVTVPDSVTSIGNRAFCICRSLMSISVDENNAKYISQDGVLFNKDKTELICYPIGKTGAYTIPVGAINIVSYAFQDCSSISSVIIPDSVTSIGDMAFGGCSSLNDIYYLGTVEDYKKIDIDTNSYIELSRIHCTDGEINNTTEEDFTFVNGVIVKYVGSQKGVYIPKTINGKTVTAIADSAFSSSSVYFVIIPDTVKTIGQNAFSSCSMRFVEIPNSVTSISSGAFSGCNSLTSVTIPDSVTSIGYRAFSGCNMLRTVNIPQGITSIDGVFSGCSRLTSVNIPSSVTSINSAFSDCSSLTSVNIPDGVTSIGESTFYYCSSLTSILIPDSVTSIGNRAFYYCSSLTSVTIPQSVTNIRGAAFSGCSSLTSVNIPDSVTSIEYGAFSGCNNLKKITLPNIQYIDQNTFNNCYILEKVTIPKTVTSIWGNAFYGCYSLSEVCYEGTKEEWQQISIASGNDCLSNATIVYNYIESKCSIYYDTNGSNDVIDTVEATIGDTIKVSGIVPQKEHYKFIGWATDNLSQVPKYLPNDEFKAEKSITLYAIWEPVPFITATYNNYGNYKLFFASFNNMPENSVIYFAEYSDGTLLSTEKRNYTSNSEVFASFEKANKYKIFVWNDDMMPLCEAYETE